MTSVVLLMALENTRHFVWSAHKFHINLVRTFGVFGPPVSWFLIGSLHLGRGRFIFIWDLLVYIYTPRIT